MSVLPDLDLHVRLFGSLLRRLSGARITKMTAEDIARVKLTKGPAQPGDDPTYARTLDESTRGLAKGERAWV